MSLLRTICCCKGEESEEEQLIDDNDESAVIQRGGPTGFSSEAINRLWATGSAGNHSGQTTPVARSLRQGDEEDELLNQILETAQQNIIDVTNIEGSVAPGNDDLNKAQRYEDAIRQHDSRIRKRSSPANSANAIITPNGENGSVGGVLLDMGSSATELISAGPSATADTAEQARQFARKVSAAVTNGIQVEHKQDILVHMSFADD